MFPLDSSLWAMLYPLDWELISILTYRLSTKTWRRSWPKSSGRRTRKQRTRSPRTYSGLRNTSDSSRKRNWKSPTSKVQVRNVRKLIRTSMESLIQCLTSLGALLFFIKSRHMIIKYRSKSRKKMHFWRSNWLCGKRVTCIALKAKLCWFWSCVTAFSVLTLSFLCLCLKSD